MMCTVWLFLPMPIKKLSGLMSLCRKLQLWKYWIREIIWSAIIRTVFKENFRPQ